MDEAGGRLLRVAVRLALAASLVLAVLSVALPAYYRLIGDKLLVVTSGSMAPTFEPGDAVVMRTVTSDELRPQMIVTFQPLRGEGLVTHRIASLHTMPGPDGRATEYIRTRGDANATYDPDLTPVANIVGIIDGQPPVCEPITGSCGRVLLWTSSPLGKLAIFGPPLVLLVAAELAAIRRQRRLVPASPPRAEAHVPEFV